MDESLQMLSDFAASTRFDDLPPDVVRRATEIFVDSLACAVGGRDCRSAQISSDYPSAPQSQHEGYVIGHGPIAAPDLAAFWNTAMVRYLDYNDLTSAGHPSDMVGALAAVAPTVGASGKDLITAQVIAYEVFVRLADKVLLENPSIDQGYAISVAATAGVCHLLGADADQTKHAMSIAATSGVPLRANRSGELSDYKGVATAVSVRDAVFFAYLGKGGLTGPSDPFEGRHGIMELVEGEAAPLDLEDFSQWRSVEACIKYFPMAYNMQPSVWTALELRKSIQPEQLAKASLHVAPFSWHESGSEPEKWDPHTRETADHSVPYVFTRALRYGTIDNDSYELAAIREPATLELMQKVEVFPDWDMGSISPTVIGARLEALDTDGQTHEVRIDKPRGHFENPMTRDEITDKAVRLVEPALGDAVDDAISTAWDVVDHDAVTVLDAFRFAGS